MNRYKIILLRIFILLLFLLLSSFAFYLAMIFPPPLLEHFLIIGIIDARTNHLNQPIFVTFSNVTMSEIRFSAGGISLACLNKGGWETNALGCFPDEIHILPSHISGKIDSNIEIPSNVIAVQVGIPYMSPTWRSDLASRIPYNSRTEPIVSYLLDLDASKRSKEEWSPIITLTNN